MKDIIKASADWYFDGPGWILMTALGILIGLMIPHRPRFWIPVAVIIILVIPLGLLIVRGG